MPVEAYIGVPGIAINVESIEEIIEAIDAIHTQVIDNLGETPETEPVFRILEHAMHELYNIL